MPDMNCLDALERLPRSDSVLVQAQLIRDSGLFDSVYYLETYPDVRLAGMDPVLHYVTHGARELRNPAPGWCTELYCLRHPELSETGINPLCHFHLNSADRDATLPWTDVEDIDLTQVKRLEKVMVEFGLNCNLRCVYCPKTFSGTHVTEPHFFVLETFSSLLDQCRALGVRVIEITGYGEATVAPDWVVFCERAFAMGLQCGMTSNLAKVFGDAEIDCLSRMNNLSVSIDTPDPEQFEALRRGCRFAVLVSNLLRIRARAMEQRRPLKIFTQSVVSNVTAEHLERLFWLGAALGTDEFYLLKLYVPTGGVTISKTQRMKDLSSGDSRRASVWRASIERMIRLGAEHGRPVRILGPVMEGLTCTATGSSDTLPPFGRGSHDSALVSTIDCTRLWTEPFVNYRGEIYPCVQMTQDMCCIGDEDGGAISPVGNVTRDPLSTVLNTPELVEMRRMFLQGTPPKRCEVCHCGTKRIHLSDFKRKITKQCI
jgi:MoaA/NifB/PqqE/SkfB family radical SAM enzyme